MGRIPPFWVARWIDGMAPKDLALNLFSIARFKGRTTYKELHNFNWIKNLKNINSVVLLEKFTLLFMALSTIQLSDHTDGVKWRWTHDRKHSVASA
jgi:hypothetical protein